MPTIRVKLREYLDANNTSAYALAKKVEGMSPETVYAVAAGKRRPSLEGLERLIAGLRSLTGRQTSLEDLLSLEG